MTWWEAAPTLGLALVVLLLPGSPVVLAGGARGLLGVALVPVLSVAVVAVAAVDKGFDPCDAEDETLEGLHGGGEIADAVLVFAEASLGLGAKQIEIERHFL